MIDRKGEVGSMLMLFVYLFLLVIIAGGIVAGTLMFFGPGYETRQVDSDVLNYRIKNCLMQNDIEKVKDDFFSNCSFSKVGLNESFYKVNVCEGSCVGNQPGIISVGSNFEVCKLSGAGENYPKCTISYIVKDGKSYEIITASNQFPRRAQ